MEPSPEEAPGLWHSLQRLGRTVLGVAENRIELLLVEFEEERWRVVDALLLVAGATVLALMTLIAGTIALVLCFPAEHRLVVLALVTGLYLLATLAVLLTLRNRLKNWRSFSATVAELKKDKACLDEKP